MERKYYSPSEQLKAWEGQLNNYFKLKALSARLVEKNREELAHRTKASEFFLRRESPQGTPLPHNKIYDEPDREPVDKLAASMFWGSPKL